MTPLEIVTVAVCAVGVLFMLLSSVGILRMPDLYTRVHANGKAGTLGIIGVLLGVGIYSADPLTLLKTIALIVFFLLTAPVAGHMLDRSAYLTSVETDRSTAVDDLEGRYDMETGRLR